MKVYFKENNLRLLVYTEDAIDLKFYWKCTKLSVYIKLIMVLTQVKLRSVRVSLMIYFAFDDFMFQNCCHKNVQLVSKVTVYVWILE